MFHLLSGFRLLSPEDSGSGAGDSLVTPPVKTFVHNEAGEFLPVNPEDTKLDTATKVESKIDSGESTPPPETKPEVLTEATVKRIAESMRPVPTPPPRAQETQVEYQARLEKLRQDTFHYTPSKQEIADMLGIENPTDKQIQVVSNILANIARHGFGLGKVYADSAVRDQVARIEQMVVPLQEAYKRQEGERMMREYYAKFPGLKPYDNVVNAAAALVNPKNADGSQKSMETIYSELTDKAQEILTSAGHKMSRADLSKAISDSAASNGGGSGQTTRSQATHSTVPRANQEAVGAGRSKGSDNQGGAAKAKPFLMPEE